MKKKLLCVLLALLVIIDCVPGLAETENPEGTVYEAEDALFALPEESGVTDTADALPAEEVLLTDIEEEAAAEEVPGETAAPEATEDDTTADAPAVSEAAEDDTTADAPAAPEAAKDDATADAPAAPEAAEDDTTADAPAEPEAAEGDATADAPAAPEAAEDDATADDPAAPEAAKDDATADAPAEPKTTEDDTTADAPAEPKTAEDDTTADAPAEPKTTEDDTTADAPAEPETAEDDATSDGENTANMTAPKITVQPVNCLAAIGEIASFSVAATNAVRYQWYYSTDQATWKKNTSTTSVHSVETTTTRYGYYYRCGITSADGSTVYSNTVRIIRPVKITSQPSNKVAALDAAVTFSVKATGAAQYQWQYTSSDTWVNVKKEGADSASLTVTVTASTYKYKYRCRIKDAMGNATYSAEGRVYKPVKITAAPSPVCTASGKTVSFSVKAENASAYQWQICLAGGSWENISGKTAETLSITATAERINAKVRCLVYNMVGKSTASAATMIYPAFSFTSQPASIVSTAGKTVTISVSAVSAKSYQWQVSENDGGSWRTTTFSGNKTKTLSIKVKTEGFNRCYRCAVTDQAGVVHYSSTAYVRQTFKLLSQPADIQAEIGKAVTLHVSANGAASFLWQYKSSSSWVSAASLSGVSGAKTDSLTVTQSKTLSAYSWRCVITDYTGATHPTDTVVICLPVNITSQPVNKTLSEGGSAVFTVVVSGTVTYDWQVLVPGSAWKSTALTGCKTASLTVPGTADRFKYSYRCKLTDPAGNVYYTNEVKMIEKFSIVTDASDISAKTGTIAVFTVKAKGVVTYRWQVNTGSAWKSTTLTGYKTASLSVPVTADRYAYLYRCQMTDGNGNVWYSNEVKLTRPLELISQTASQTVDWGAAVSFTVKANGAVKYQWYYYTKSQTPAQASASTISGAKTATISVTANQDYLFDRYWFCRMTDANGKTLDSAPVCLFRKLKITTQPAGTEVTVGKTVTLSVVCTGTGLEYLWQYSKNGTTWSTASALTGYKTAKLSIGVTDSNCNNYYRCVIKGENNQKVTSAVAHLTPACTIVTQPASKTAAVGTTVSFTVKASGAKTYQWQVKADGVWQNTYLDGYNTATLRVQVFRIRYHYSWRCVITCTNGKTLTTNTVTISEKSSSVTVSDSSKIVYDVPVYEQLNYGICWSVAQQMVDDFAIGIEHTLSEALDLSLDRAYEELGSRWNDGGNPTDEDKNDIVWDSDFNMRDLYVDLVTHGPLYAVYGEWNSSVTTRVGGHELVIVGVDLGSNRVYVNNPWGVSGSQSQSDFLYDFYDGSYTHDHTEYVSGVGTVHWEFDCYTHLDD